jgi:hypothetical protein
VNNVLDSNYKTGGYEQARNANFRQLNQDVSSGTPSLVTNILRLEERISLISTSVLN